MTTDPSEEPSETILDTCILNCMTGGDWAKVLLSILFLLVGWNSRSKPMHNQAAQCEILPLVGMFAISEMR